MAEILKSALFVDYDSIHRSLAATGREGDALAQRTSAWVVAIESGRLVTTKTGATTRRRFALRRCYADPTRLGKNRIAFVAAGFELIDCPVPAEGQKNAAGMSIALDVIEALAHPTAYEEFVLLSADTDLAPIIQRLHSLERTAVIYAAPTTAASLAELADGVVEEAKLASLLFADDAPAPRPAASAPAPGRAAPAGSGRPPAPPPAARPAAAVAAAGAPAGGQGDRADIEALARRIHGATNVPLLSPRTFAELFKALAEEVTERGYHFQETAERVSSKLTSAGRNVTRRQVVFVVKGLALKGHVFSTTDSAERLAEVFREQVIYLVGNAALELTDRERALLPAWITSRAGTVTPPASAAATPPTAPASPASAEEKAGRRKPTRPPEAKAAAPAPATAPEAKAPPARPPEPERPAAAASARPAQPPRSQPRPPSSPKPAPPQKPAAKPAPARPQAKEAASSEALESSILAAIAQAVDVLIEDGNAATGGKEPDAPVRSREAEPAATTTDQPKPDPTPSEGGEGDDIGDEIQRIIASYSRARQQGDT